MPCPAAGKTEPGGPCAGGCGPAVFGRISSGYPPVVTSMTTSQQELIRFLEDRFACAQACTECARACALRASLADPDGPEGQEQMRRKGIMCAEVCDATCRVLSEEANLDEAAFASRWSGAEPWPWNARVSSTIPPAPRTAPRPAASAPRPARTSSPPSAESRARGKGPAPACSQLLEHVLACAPSGRPWGAWRRRAPRIHARAAAVAHRTTCLLHRVGPGGLLHPPCRPGGAEAVLPRDHPPSRYGRLARRGVAQGVRRTRPDRHRTVHLLRRGRPGRLSRCR